MVAPDLLNLREEGGLVAWILEKGFKGQKLSYQPVYLDPGCPGARNHLVRLFLANMDRIELI